VNGSVAEHHDPIGDFEDVGDVVADHDDPEPPITQLPDQSEDLPGFTHSQRCGRLIHQNDGAAPARRPCDRDGLPLTAGEIRDRGVHRRQVDSKLGDVLTRLGVHHRLVHETEPSQRTANPLFPPEEEVGGHVEGLHERQVLVHGLDPRPAGVVRFVELDRFAVDRHGSLVGPVDPGQHLDQCRFPGTVVADEPDHFAAGDLEVHAAEHLHRTEREMDVGGCEIRGTHGGASPEVRKSFSGIL
jgi:hypothetical protein